MSRLFERYLFDWRRIFINDGYHIEYSITDICNRRCKSCSHLAPLAKKANFVSREEFTRVVKLMRNLIPDAHTFWLTGGEPTLHPDYIKLLKILRDVYPDVYIGIYSNGIKLKEVERDIEFWDFVRENGVVWAVTNYDIPGQYFIDLFNKYDCKNNLAIIQSGKTFARLTNYSYGQSVSYEKYLQCGWERCKINIRNGRIFNCAASEFVDLFNDFFGEKLVLSDKDYLEINDKLTRKHIDEFRGPMPFCGQCDIRLRHRDVFRNECSQKRKCEWSDIT